jgi:hypothetical protein
MSDIPHSAIVRTQLAEFLADTHVSVERISASLGAESEFSAIFRNSAAGFAVLTRLARRNRVSLLSTAAGIVRRCPLLMAVGQLQLA